MLAPLVGAFQSVLSCCPRDRNAVAAGVSQPHHQEQSLLAQFVQQLSGTMQPPKRVKCVARHWLVCSSKFHHSFVLDQLPQPFENNLGITVSFKVGRYDCPSIPRTRIGSATALTSLRDVAQSQIRCQLNMDEESPLPDSLAVL